MRTSRLARRCGNPVVTSLAAAASLTLLLASCSNSSPDSQASASGIAARSSAARTGKVHATGPVSRQNGGKVKAGGVVLTVPAGVVAHNTTATIATRAPGIYDISIDGSWHGDVRVTVPLRSADDVVLHQIGGYWMPETAPGVATAVVIHLSPFTTLLTKGLSAICIRNTVAKALTCLAEKGIKHIDKSLAGWLASKLSTSCAAALFADVYGVVDVFWGALSEPACTGQAGESGYTPGPSRSSNSHSTGTPPRSSTGSSRSNSPTVPAASPPPPGAKTYAEAVGGPSHSWTNYSNAGGVEGPTIPAYTTVQVSCVVTGFKVADGNTAWYRIASSPWNNQYYVSADAFYNNGATSGSLRGTPFVDPAVRPC